MKQQFERIEAAKPHGGYVLIRPIQFFSAWWCYESGQISLADLRVWFALHELVARRCRSSEGRLPQYRIDELMALTRQKREGAIRKSLRRLEESGLATCRKTSIRIHNRPTRIVGRPTFEERFAQIANRRRPVPMPRRIVRRIAANAKASFIAGVVGHALRLLYVRNGMCRADGNCKASWIASVFEIDVASVKRARRELIATGILQRQKVPQWYKNRYGWRGAFNLNWDASRGYNLPPPRRKTHRIATTKTKPKTLFESKTPIRDAKSGFSKNIGRLTMADLNSPSRTEAVFQKACSTGVVTKGDRLNVFAAAERAKRKGMVNPVGMFVWLIGNRKWDFPSMQDQDAGLERMKWLDSAGRRRGDQVLRSMLADRGIEIRTKESTGDGWKHELARLQTL